MKETGRWVTLVGKVSFTTLMVMFTRGLGITIRPMATELTLMRKEQGMKDTGKMISNTEKEWRPGMKGQSMKEFIIWGRRKDMESTHGQMVQCMKENG